MAIHDTFIPVWYHITVTNLTGAAPADGFIDHQNPQDFPAFPSTLALSRAKERARMRYEGMLQQLALVQMMSRTMNIVATASTEDTEATDFQITVQYDRPEYVATEDEDNPGTILEGVDAVTRFVARALVVDTIVNREIYDPTVSSGNPRGPVIEEVTAGKIAADLATAEAAITVIESDLTT